MPHATSRRVLLAAAAATLAAPRLGRAQDAAGRPIRLIVTFPPGGSGDMVARVLAPGVGERLRQPIVVDNRPGAGGNIGMDFVAKAVPDGTVIGIGAAGAMSINGSMYASMPFDAQRDLAPVTMLASSPFILVVQSRSEVRTLQDLLRVARSRPDGLTIAHGGIGSTMHITAELVNQLGQVKITPVPYRGVGPSLTAVVAGDTDLAVLDPPAALPLLQEGRLRALAVSSTQRFAALPDVPTAAEAGLPGYETTGWMGLVAPARTPEPIIARLNEAFTAVLRDPTTRERFATLGMTPEPGTPEEFRRFIASETAKMGQVVRSANIRAE
ncbi:Bug family tripartite tricarboxylate transporter substrate binding protein [Roseomonas sp. BN140053]|uniref:Bug family tripartite tricarboxylate transporter substrate binding protein n=1 Tax=Roseomonas sp. BN140053 TaxID=3391898 RepID=UPI0039ED8A69